MEAGSRDFPDAGSAAASPLAEALFRTGEVEGVFFGRDFVSVTATPGVDWAGLEIDVVQILLDHFIAGGPLFAPGSAAGILVADDAEEATFGEDPADAEIVAQIKELLETRVRPAVAQDGGDIVYRGYKDGTLFLAMQGACSGCPSSAVTLKRGVENLIRHYVPEVETVEAI
jgi:Fe-S cluster biogenesis protein NfuA